MTVDTRILRTDALSGEPPLGDVLADPIVHAVMARDGISPSELRRLVVGWQGRHPRLTRRPPQTQAA